MSLTTLFLLSLPLAQSAAQANQYGNPEKRAPRPTTPAITEADLMSRLYVFADDSMEGRNAPLASHARGSAYIVRELQRLRIAPAGNLGSYYQTLPYVQRTLSPRTTLTVDGVPLTLGTDFTVTSRGTTRIIDSARTIFAGFGIGLAYKTAMSAFKLWKDVPEKVFAKPFAAGSVAAEISPELLGVGYIIGPKIAAVMCGGGVLAYLVLIPLIKFFGDGLQAPLPPGAQLISEMGPNEIRGAYVLYIGAGAVAAGGIISLFRSLPVIWHGLREGLRDLTGARGAGEVARTDRDLSMKFVGLGVVLLVAAILLSPSLHMNPLGALLIVVFGFLFVTVSSRLTGEIGSSSNPISGMTVATLLLTCLIFLLVGWTGASWYVTALSVGGIVCIAASNGGTTSQDLKTGYLVGATPRLQQVAILIGSLLSALVLGPILLKLNDAATVYAPVSQVAPTALAADPARVSTTREGLR
ncbi:MAG: OPT/YSL family transporter, partial [Gemmatimonadaceae bacterium]|nr:OPT/YSL family transporter [Gemmatimonadaceae bacterium]